MDLARIVVMLTWAVWAVVGALVGDLGGGVVKDYCFHAGDPAWRARAIEDGDMVRYAPDGRPVQILKYRPIEPMGLVCKIARRSG
jgi:hypothetical protein